MKGYLNHEMPELALDVYQGMMDGNCEPDKSTYHLAITACMRSSRFDVGYQIGRRVVDEGLVADVLVGTPLIGLYFKAGDVEAARKVFVQIEQLDLASWNAMIAGYTRLGFLTEAMELFKHMKFNNMVMPSSSTLSSLIAGFCDAGFLEGGEAMHGYVVKTGFCSNLFVANSVLEMYIRNGYIDKASAIFDRMAVKDAVTWSSMIGGYVQHGLANFGLGLFQLMVSNSGVLPTRTVLLNAIAACTALGEWREGEFIAQTYVFNPRSNLSGDKSLVTALMYMRAKCGRIEHSLELLNEYPDVTGDVVAWNAVLKVCEEFKLFDQAFQFMLEMQRRGILADEITFLAMLTIASLMPSMKKGTEAHAIAMRRGFTSDTRVANALITMYGRCGSLKDSGKVFREVSTKNIITWTSIIQVYAWNGDAAVALAYFDLLRGTELQPDEYTFLAVLSACKNVGLVDEGLAIFKIMKEQYGLLPQVEHFGCMFDMLCRAGRTCDAYDFLRCSMPEQADNSILWSSLFTACRVHSDVATAQAAASYLSMHARSTMPSSC